MKKGAEKIVEAAIRMFLRYGVKRTTMNDIASEAGIVRQTLYNVFANKDEVLKATINWHVDQSLAAIETASARALTLGEKLDCVFEHMTVKPFEQIQAMPHAEDIITGFNDAARKEVADANEQYRQVIEGILIPHEATLHKAGINVQQLSDLVQTSAIGFKHSAKNENHLRELLTSLKLLVLTVVANDIL